MSEPRALKSVPISALSPARGRVPPLDRAALSLLIFRALQLLGDRLGPGAMSGAAWTMLMELYLNEGRRPISTKSLCLLSGAPMRTALRILDGLVTRNLVVRRPDARDRRQVNISLSRTAIRMMNGCFDELISAGEQVGARR